MKDGRPPEDIHKVTEATPGDGNDKQKPMGFRLIDVIIIRVSMLGFAVVSSFMAVICLTLSIRLGVDHDMFRYYLYHGISFALAAAGFCLVSLGIIAMIKRGKEEDFLPEKVGGAACAALIAVTTLFQLAVNFYNG